MVYLLLLLLLPLGLNGEHLFRDRDTLMERLIHLTPFKLLNVREIKKKKNEIQVTS